MALLSVLVRMIGQMIFRPCFFVFSLVISILSIITRITLRLSTILCSHSQHNINPKVNSRKFSKMKFCSRWPPFNIQSSTKTAFLLDIIIMDVVDMVWLLVACLGWLWSDKGLPIPSLDSSTNQFCHNSTLSSPARPLTRRSSFRRKSRSGRRGYDDIVETLDETSTPPTDSVDTKTHTPPTNLQKLLSVVSNLNSHVLQRVHLHQSLSLSSCLYPQALTACCDPKLFQHIYEATRDIAYTMKDELRASVALEGLGQVSSAGSDLGCGFHPRLASYLSSLSCLAYESKQTMELTFPSQQGLIFHSFKVEEVRGFVAASGDGPFDPQIAALDL